MLLPVALAFGGLELSYLLDQQQEAGPHSIMTVQHAGPAAMREALQPTAAVFEEVPLPLQPCTQTQLLANPSPLSHAHPAASGLLATLSPPSHANPAQEPGVFVLLRPLVTLVLAFEVGLFVLFKAMGVRY